MTKQARARWWTKITRDLVLLASGIALTVNEALFRAGSERPSLYVLFAGMMGLGPVLRYAEARAEREKTST